VQGLILRLAHLEASAESAVRVIAFFDALVEQGASLDHVMRSAAALVGVRSPQIPEGLRVGGGPTAEGLPTVVRQLAAGGEVWLERERELLSQDQILLDRFVIVCSWRLYSDRYSAAATRRSCADRVGHQPVCGSRRAGSGAVSPWVAARRLAFGSRRPWSRRAPERGPQKASVTVRSAAIGAGTVLLVGGLLPADLAVCAGRAGRSWTRVPSLEAPESWECAHDEVQFASPAAGLTAHVGQSTSVISWSELGSMAILPQRITAAEIYKVADIGAIDEIVVSSGRDIVRALEAYCAAASLWRTAQVLQLHHKSVGTRVARAGSVGFRVFRTRRLSARVCVGAAQAA